MIWLTAEAVNAQRVLVDEKEINEVERNRELYSSLFFFDESLREHMKKYNTVAGYDGPVYGHHFVMDFDGRDLYLVIEAMRPLIRELERMAVPYYLFFSGSKGFHLYIPKHYVEYPEELESKWDVASKLFARQLIDTYPELTEFLDLSIYDKVRIFRYPYSRHPASGKRKMRCKYHASADGDAHAKAAQDKVINKAAVGDIFTKSDASIRQTIGEIFHGVKDKPEDVFLSLEVVSKTMNGAVVPPSVETSIMPGNREFSYPYAEKHCVYKMLNDHIAHMKRHRIALRLQTYWREKGYPVGVVQSLIRYWNDGLETVRGQGPLNEKELQNIFKYGGRYVFTCDDEIKRQYCATTCMSYKQKNIYKKRIHIGDRYISGSEGAGQGIEGGSLPALSGSLGTG